MNTSLARLVAILVATLGGCQMQEATPAGARVAMTRDPLPPTCRELGQLVGTGGGIIGGGYIPNDDLIEYAWSSIRNQGAEMGATHVRVDAPQLGSASGTTSTATVSGSAYVCEKTPANVLAAQNIEAITPDPIACAEAAQYRARAERTSEKAVRQQLTKIAKAKQTRCE